MMSGKQKQVNGTSNGFCKTFILIISYNSTIVEWKLMFLRHEIEEKGGIKYNNYIVKYRKYIVRR